MTEKMEGGLTAAEEAYFETGGEAPLEQDAGTASETPETKEASEAGAEIVEEAPKEQPTDKDRDEKGRFVPHGALHAEREEHKKTKAEVEDLKRFKIQMEERFRLAEEAKRQAEQQENDPYAQEPDHEADPMEWIKWRREVDRSEREARQKETAEQKAIREREETIQSHTEFVTQHFSEAIKVDPDVQDAYKAATDSLDRELQLLGYRGQALEQARKQTFENFVLHASNAVQNGTPIGEFIKGLAVSRGWQKAAQQEAQQSQELTLPEQLSKVADAQDASRTIGQASGRAGGDELSLEQICDLPQNEFAEWYANPKNASRFDRLMGAR